MMEACCKGLTYLNHNFLSFALQQDVFEYLRGRQDMRLVSSLPDNILKLDQFAPLKHPITNGYGRAT